MKRSVSISIAALAKAEVARAQSVWISTFSVGRRSANVGGMQITNACAVFEPTK
jgi:hypothetical protein